MSNDNNEDIYIDLLATCSVQTSSSHRVPLVFNQTSSQPILKSTTSNHSIFFKYGNTSHFYSHDEISQRNNILNHNGV